MAIAAGSSPMVCIIGWYRSTAVCLVAALMLGINTVTCGEQTCPDAMRTAVDCYECNTREPDSHYCADPFNRTHPRARTAVCEGPCSKWIQRQLNGPTYYVRTCSANVNHRLVLALVCMKESRPGDGQLCFCHRPLCNAAAPAMYHRIWRTENHSITTWRHTFKHVVTINGQSAKLVVGLLFAVFLNF